MPTGFVNLAATNAGVAPQVDADRSVFADAEEQRRRAPRGYLHRGQEHGNDRLQYCRGSRGDVHREICIGDGTKGQ
jgi:hypothetical protein